MSDLNIVKFEQNTSIGREMDTIFQLKILEQEIEIWEETDGEMIRR